ncbi:BAx inhibitor (BI)-1/yccA-like protein family [Cotonvirus japonicus]|uniref:BAx inhibitor (BI)-1/yccA-like protein family n=1 Tax=Cotonvirus japonicus TaxID=2811091 RepID=A0ABM7NRW1_9VIRU|nr:BAx inhibitor (BI)-1/yccA-like protein family [Cotonvirus japonicus]BCS82902.1 BAx inhibitor (BI)-1/yccA-like protein family [Cotonvirus japonicus]
MTVLNEVVWKTYILLAASIICYLIGAHIPLISNPIINIVTLISILILVIYIKHYLLLFCFALNLGFIHNLMFEIIFQMNPNIIIITLGSTFLTFGGLSLIAFNVKTNNVNIFVIYGVLYTSLSTILWLTILNIFLEIELLSLLITYVSIVIFSLYTIIDTYKMIHSPNSNPVDHALSLFLNFINLFVDIVKIISGKSQKK